MTARLLIIAGSDSGGGAGIQADIKTVTMLGGHAMTAITAITAQNTLGVQAVHPVPTDIVLAQIDSVAGDIGVDAVKIGMIGSAQTANAVADRLTSLFSREGGSPDWTPAFAGEQGYRDGPCGKWRLTACPPPTPRASPPPPVTPAKAGVSPVWRAPCLTR